MFLFAVMCAGLVVAGSFEAWMHRRRLDKLALRIQVNGTRGKSTVTRLIAAGLRAGGRQVVAKTTGTAATIIFEDGSEEPVRRRGQANIKEQMWAVRMAAARRADSLVIECMALEPENQWVSEHRMVRSHIGVITNVRDDHLDVMGPTLDDVAKALALTVPDGGTLVTAETDEKLLAIIRDQASRVGAEVRVADPESVPDEAIQAFDYVSFKENVACALEVCEIAGVSRDVALAGMVEAQGDPGVMRIWKVRMKSTAREGDADGSGAVCESEYVLASAFAANDRTSTRQIWGMLVDRGLVDGIGLPVAVVMNNRQDRMPRLEELARFIADELGPMAESISGRHVQDHAPANGRAMVFLVGQAGRVGADALKRAGVPAKRVCDLTHVSRPEQVIQAIATEMPGGAFLFGIGNTRGMGQKLAEYFESNGEQMPGGGQASDFR